MADRSQLRSSGVTPLERCRYEQRKCVLELANPTYSATTKWLVRLGLQDWVKEEVRLMAQRIEGTPVQLRLFDTGATRDLDTGKLDYEGFLSPAVIRRYAEYMHKNREQPDGTFRASDNWQLGIPKDAYVKSAWRHFLDWWTYHRGGTPNESIEDALCALMFNTQGYLSLVLKERLKSDSPQKVGC